MIDLEISIHPAERVVIRMLHWLAVNSFRRKKEIMLRRYLNRRHMNLLAVAALVCGQAAFADKPGAEVAPYKSLFDSKTLDGWDGDPKLWSVKDGVIHGETTAENPAKGNTFLIWKGGALKDFELKLQFRCNVDNNSGIQYRSKHITEGKVSNAWVVRGYQHELRNEATFPNVSGFIYDEGGKRGRICLLGEIATWEKDGKKVTGQLIDQAAYEKLFKVNDWNEVTIIARGNHIEHYMNGVKVLDFTDSLPENALLEGIIALQLHAGKPMWAEFKEIHLRDLAR